MADRSRELSGLTNVLMVITIIGAINWGLVGFFNWNLVNAIFGGDVHEAASALSRVIYAIVGLCGLAVAFMLPRIHFVSREPGAPTITRRTEVHP